MLIGPWAAMDGPVPQVPTLVHGTSSPAPRFQALPDWKVCLHQGLTPFHQGACLLLFMAPRLFVPKGTCRSAPSYPQRPPQPPSHAHWCPKSGGG